jgi:hypothetical protein
MAFGSDSEEQTARQYSSEECNRLCDAILSWQSTSEGISKMDWKAIAITSGIKVGEGEELISASECRRIWKYLAYGVNINADTNDPPITVKKEKRKRSSGDGNGNGNGDDDCSSDEEDYCLHPATSLRRHALGSKCIDETYKVMHEQLKVLAHGAHYYQPSIHSVKPTDKGSVVTPVFTGSKRSYQIVMPSIIANVIGSETYLRKDDTPVRNARAWIKQQPIIYNKK